MPHSTRHRGWLIWREGSAGESGLHQASVYTSRDVIDVVIKGLNDIEQKQVDGGHYPSPRFKYFPVPAVIEGDLTNAEAL